MVSMVQNVKSQIMSTWLFFHSLFELRMGISHRGRVSTILPWFHAVPEPKLGFCCMAIFGTNSHCYGEVCVLSKTVWNFARANPGQKRRFQKLSKVLEKMGIQWEYSETWPEINNCKDGSPASSKEVENILDASPPFWRKWQLGKSLLTLVQHHDKWPGWLGKACARVLSHGECFLVFHPSARFERCGGCSCKYRYGGLELESQDFPPLLCKKDVRRG